MSFMRAFTRAPTLCSRTSKVMINSSLIHRQIFARPTTTSLFFRTFSTDIKISTDLIKKLRSETDAPLGHCKKALEESGGDMDKAKDWLRKKGLQTAQSKSSRTAVEGLVGVLTDVDQRIGVLVEINCETDFVMRNEQFQSVVGRITKAVLEHCKQNQLVDGEVDGEVDVEKLKHDVKIDGKSAAHVISELAGVIRENIQLRRVTVLRASEDINVIGHYIHNAKSDNAGSIGALVEIAPSGNQAPDKEELKRLGREVAMHVIGMDPKYTSRDQVPLDVLEHERSLQKEKALKDGKTENVVDKIVEGQLKKWYSQIVLLDQPWVLDQKQTVEKIVKSKNATVKKMLSIRS